MSRSGGTAQYQIATEIVETYALGSGAAHGPIEDRGTTPSVVVKKEPAHEWAIDMVKNGRAIAIGIYRDPRDVTVSLMKFLKARGKGDHTFARSRWSWENAILWWKKWEPLCAHVARYEDVHPGGWGKEAEEIASVIGIELEDGEAERIARKWCLERNKIRQGQNVQWLERRTMLVRAHVSETLGESVWRDVLTKEQAMQVEDFAGAKWMEEHGYSLLDR